MGLCSWVVLPLSRVRVPPVCLQRRVRVSWGSSALACGEKRGGSGWARLRPASPQRRRGLSSSRAAVRRVSGSPLQVNKLILALAFLKESLQHFSSFLLVLMRHAFQEMY